MDFQGLGYFISTVSVLFLGVVAWPGPTDPDWHPWAVFVGMATSILGMFFRYLAHRKTVHEIHRAERNAKQS